MSYYLRNDGTTRGDGWRDKPEAATVRHRYDSARWSVTTPGDKMYSTACDCAEEFFDGTNWRPIAEVEIKTAAVGLGPWVRVDFTFPQPTPPAEGTDT